MQALAFRIKAALWLLYPLLAFSAEQAARRVDPSALPLWTWGMVAVFSLLGFLISSAEDLFGWLDEGGKRQLGKLVARFSGSIAAGVTAYFLAMLGGAYEILALLSVTPAAYAGETYIRRLADRKGEIDAGKVG